MPKGNLQHAGRFMKKPNMVILTALLCLLLIATQPALWAIADDETSTNAEVTVVEEANESYGMQVISSRNVWAPGRALGKPDNYGAIFYRNSQMTIRLENRVQDCTTLNIWAVNIWWGYSRLSIYYSADGTEWSYAGTIRPSGYIPSLYSLSGDYGEVEYMRIKRNGFQWSFGIVDAVCAKGGGA